MTAKSDPIGHRIIAGEGATNYLVKRSRWLTRTYPKALILVVCSSVASRTFLSRKLGRCRKIRVATIKQVLQVDPLVEKCDFLLVEGAHLMEQTEYNQLGSYVSRLAKADVTIVYDRTQLTTSRLINFTTFR